MFVRGRTCLLAHVLACMLACVLACLACRHGLPTWRPAMTLLPVSELQPVMLMMLVASVTLVMLVTSV